MGGFGNWTRLLLKHDYGANDYLPLKQSFGAAGEDEYWGGEEVNMLFDYWERLQ
jgi:hypothetical protein